MSRSSLTNLHERYGLSVTDMVTGGMERLVEGEGGYCKGFSLRMASGDALLVIRAEFEGVPKVAFVNGYTGAGCLSKAHKLLINGGLDWRVDKYRV